MSLSNLIEGRTGASAAAALSASAARRIAPATDNLMRKEVLDENMARPSQIKEEATENPGQAGAINNLILSGGCWRRGNKNGSPVRIERTAAVRVTNAHSFFLRGSSSGLT